MDVIIEQCLPSFFSVLSEGVMCRFISEAWLSFGLCWHGFGIGCSISSVVNDIVCILLLEAPVKRLDPPCRFGSRGRFMTDLLVDHSRFAHERFDGGAAYPRVPFWRMGM